MYEDNPFWDRDYGSEWRAITKAAKKASGHRCKRCKKLYHDVELDTHHIIPVSTFIEEGYPEEGPAHYCHGVVTVKAWHCEQNLEVICYHCHGKEHPRLGELYDRMEIVGNRRVFKKDLEKFR